MRGGVARASPRDSSAAFSRLWQSACCSFFGGPFRARRGAGVRCGPPRRGHRRAPALAHPSRRVLPLRLRPQRPARPRPARIRTLPRVRRGDDRTHRGRRPPAERCRRCPRDVPGSGGRPSGGRVGVFRLPSVGAVGSRSKRATRGSRNRPGRTCRGRFERSSRPAPCAAPRRPARTSPARLVPQVFREGRPANRDGAEAPLP